MGNLISFFLGSPWMSMLGCQNVMKCSNFMLSISFHFLMFWSGRLLVCFLCSFVAYYTGFVFDSFYYGFEVSSSF
jgi:hypothetical protein